MTRPRTASAASVQVRAASTAAKPDRMRRINRSRADAAARSDSPSTSDSPDASGSVRRCSSNRSQSPPPITGNRVRVRVSTRRDDTATPESSRGVTEPSAMIDSNSARGITDVSRRSRRTSDRPAGERPNVESEGPYTAIPASANARWSRRR